MEIILMERVEKLGQMGDVVKVRPGYARNYLLPQKKALRATKANLAYFDSRRAQFEAQNLERKTDAQAVAGKLGGTKVVALRSAGASGQLYGSVTARDVADLLTEAGFTVSRGQISIDTPIKTLGLFDLKVRLHPEVAATITVNVARSEDEAAMQDERGGMITSEILEAEEIAREAAEAEARARALATDDEDEDEAAEADGDRT